MKQEMKALIKTLRGQGWTATLRKGGHWKLTSPDGKPYFTGATPSDHRALRNARADLRRLGAVL